MLKKLVVRFGLKTFAERTLISWWAVLEKLGREREEALLPGPIKGLAQFLLRIDTKVTFLTDPQVLLFLKTVMQSRRTFIYSHFKSNNIQTALTDSITFKMFGSKVMSPGRSLLILPFLSALWLFLSSVWPDCFGSSLSSWL